MKFVQLGLGLCSNKRPSVVVTQNAAAREQSSLTVLNGAPNFNKVLQYFSAFIVVSLGKSLLEECLSGSKRLRL